MNIRRTLELLIQHRFRDSFQLAVRTLEQPFLHVGKNLEIYAESKALRSSEYSFIHALHAVINLPGLAAN
jgi:hypothetical protein